jgi:predicted DNA-binding transcriptional regulator AlpA
MRSPKGVIKLTLMRYLTVKQVMQKLQCDRMTLWRLRTLTDFPKPIVLGERSIRFAEQELDDYFLGRRGRC